jgi:type IV pilus assembly protein PilB
VRDRLTAEIAIKLANTGHLTFCTLHTNDATSVVSRFFKMGIEPFLVAQAINIVVAQRLVQSLCPECKRPATSLDPQVPRRLGFTAEEASETVFFEAVGCSNCHGGYLGRVAIHEALFFTREIRRLVVEASEDINEEALVESAAKNGMVTLRGSGRERIKQGLTTCEEIMAITRSDR